MKLFNVLLLLFFVNLNYSQSLFEKTDLVDEFGDKTGEVQRNISRGTFSNSATTNSSLVVQTILEIMPKLNFEEYKIYATKKFKQMGLKDNEITNVMLKYGFNQSKNTNGTIRFILYEYEDIKANTIGVERAIISIKTKEGKKMRAFISDHNISNGSVTITGYKELTGGLTGVENQIKYGTYDWSQTEIYNEIFNANGPVQVVITFGNSTYNFTLE